MTPGEELQLADARVTKALAEWHDSADPRPLAVRWELLGRAIDARATVVARAFGGQPPKTRSLEVAQ